MLHVLLVSEDPLGLSGVAAPLAVKEGIKVSRVMTGQEVLKLIDQFKIDVVVVDETIADGDVFDFVRELTMKQPLINCAMVSTLSPEDFHEATEGLGVFMQLPVAAGSKEAEKMVQLLESIDALLGM